MPTLFELTEQQRAIEDALYESGGELTPEIEQALVETSESLPRKIDGYNHILRELAAMEQNCATEIERLTRLKRIAQNGQKTLKKHVMDAMKMFGFKRLDGNTCKMTLSSRAGLEVDEDVLLSDVQKRIDEFNATLPDYVTVEVKVSKSAINSAYKASGVLPAGVTVNSTDSLTVR